MVYSFFPFMWLLPIQFAIGPIGYRSYPYHVAPMLAFKLVLYSILVRMMNDFVLSQCMEQMNFTATTATEKRKRKKNWMEKMKCARHPTNTTILVARLKYLLRRGLWSGVTYVRWTESVCMNNATYYILIIIRLVTIAPLLTI